MPRWGAGRQRGPPILANAFKLRVEATRGFSISKAEAHKATQERRRESFVVEPAGSDKNEATEPRQWPRTANKSQVEVRGHTRPAMAGVPKAVCNSICLACWRYTGPRCALHNQKVSIACGCDCTRRTWIIES
jgi:hypothetical protein